MDETRQTADQLFPGGISRHAADEIPAASTATVANWDSVAAITMMNVVEDEFRLEMDLDDLADLDSFEKIHAYLLKRQQVA